MKLIRRKTLHRIYFVVLAAAVFAAGLLAVKYFAKPKQVKEQPTAAVQPEDPYAADDDVARIYFQNRWYKQKQNCRTVLLIGVDDRGEQQDYGGNINHAQADFLLLLVVDDGEKTYTALQLNRDTMTDIPVIGLKGEYAGTKVAQLALAHTYGSGLQDSCEYTAEAVSDLLFGTRIDHYAALSMDSVGVLNDQVGGVTVQVPVDMTQYDPALENGAEVTLNAAQAELFVRARQGLADETNLYRMERQRIFLNAWKQAALPRARQDADFALELAMNLSEYLVSDMTANQISDFANNLTEYTDLGVQETSGQSAVGEKYMEFHIDREALERQVVELFYEEDEKGGPPPR